MEPKMRCCARFMCAACLVIGCSKETGGADDAGDAEGDAVRGGALYDNWWAVTKQDAPTDDHPLWADRPDDSSAVMGADTWRCKECHGWDYKGTDGAYGSGSHRTGFAGILDSTKSAAQIVALLNDADDHDYGSVLDEQDLADLAAFVRDGTVDTADFIDEDKTFAGQADDGQSIFEGTCADCHGEEGLNEEPTGSDGGFEDFPGLIANENPYEFLHKVRFGQPGKAMPPQAEELSDSELSALGAYAQTLPQAP